MTERKLWNGWSSKKAVKGFLIFVLLMYFVAWLIEAAWYQVGLDSAIWRLRELKKAGESTHMEPYEFMTGKDSVFGLCCAVVTMVFLAVTVVHRESFRENWDVTLRRIPKYRGKYLLTKLTTICLPGVLYMMYCGGQCLWRLNVYNARVPEALRTGEAVDVWKLVHHKSIGEIVLYFVLFALLLLSGSLVLRRIRKDWLGVGAVACGMIITGLLFFDVPVFHGAWELPIVSKLLVLIVIEALILVRHVYRKL